MAAQHTETAIDSPASQVELSAETLEASTGFVGRWQTLVSTTNWEKGRIVCEWRAALERSGAPVTEYSDEAWARLVGDVTGQHVGRLRRTYDRFGGVFQEYEGLYWSHFQTALDWPDAEMWLEGALQNDWSIAQMRAKRWETVGDAQAPDESAPPSSSEADDALGDDSPEVVTAVDSEVRPAADPADELDDEPPSDLAAAERRQPVRPLEDLAELPDDLADAFEQFKLAILNHKLAGWAEVSRDDVVASLRALEQLTLAPSGD